MSSETRTFLLQPIGGPPATAGQPLRMGFLPTGETETRVAIREATGAILVRKPSGRLIEQLIAIEVAEALLAVCGRHILSVVIADAGAWRLRIYKDGLWGLVLGDVAREDWPAATPPSPEGWRVVREVSDRTEFTDRRLALLDPFTRDAFLVAEGVER